MVTSATGDEIQYSQLDELDQVAKKIALYAPDIKVWTFDGQMGAGKTTLIKAICHYFQVEDNVTSPTFSLVNEYHSKQGDIFYHFDFYRLKEESEALDIGVEEYLYSGDYCFIEWPSKIESLLPSELLHISIELENNLRKIKLSKKQNIR